MDLGRGTSSTPDRRGAEARATRVAVVVPLYGQAQFVDEAVISVLRQTASDTRVIIVNDGCPDPASRGAGLALSYAYPERVIYTEQPNRGLSGARNAGIRWALATWPDLVGVLPLDADNHLEHDAVERLLVRLDAADDPDWVNPHLQMFGEKRMRWRLAAEPTHFRQLFENQADAVALIRPRVFAAGVWYDETMREGYEDWDFYLRAFEAGFRGVSDPTATMHYRSRFTSMLAAAESRDAAIRDHMRATHRRSYRARSRTALEHRSHPRFEIVDEFGHREQVTDPQRCQADRPSVLPPIVVFARRGAIEALSTAGLWRGVLFTGQPRHVGDVHVVTLASSDRLAVTHETVRSGDAAVAALVTRELIESVSADELQSFLRAAHATRVAMPLAHEAPRGWSDAELGDVARRWMAVQHRRAEPDDPSCGYVSDDHFSSWLQLELVRSSMPLADDGRRHIGFVMPWLKLGGVEHCVLQIAAAIRRSAPDVAIHLALTESGTVETNPRAALGAFDSITAIVDPDRARRVLSCELWGASMDLVINAHSGVAYEAARARPRGGASTREGLEVAYLHVLDATPEGLIGGWPKVAAAQEGTFDHMLVISETMAAAVVNDGVPRRKVTVAPNAPVVRPHGDLDGTQLADAKADRLVAGGTPRVLIAGRLDHQKGGRRAAALIRDLHALGRRFELTVLGEPTLEAEIPEFPDGLCTWHPAVHDPALLSEHFARADVLLLLSRWEGVPLVMLDAMAHGVVVVATDVGGVGEVAIDRRNARLIEGLAERSDDAIVDDAVRVMTEILDDTDGNRAIRRQAVDDVEALDWSVAAEAILGLMDRKDPS